MDRDCSFLTSFNGVKFELLTAVEHWCLLVCDGVYFHMQSNSRLIFCVVITEQCNVMVNIEELIGTTGYLTL
jgi:hypothetical protein